MYNSKISGLGYYVPNNIVTNDDLSKIMDTSDDWIKERTGILQRRWIEKNSGDTTSVMGVKAAEMAIKNAGITKDDIDFIVFATLSPDYFFPGGGRNDSRYDEYGYHRGIGCKKSMFWIYLCIINC